MEKSNQIHPCQKKWFNTVYQEKWEIEPPSNCYYDAYALILKTRSGLGKTVFMSKDSPHSDMLLKSFASMLKNKDNVYETF